MSEPNNEAGSQDSAKSGPFEALGRKLDERPEVRAAEDALRQAREQFERAQSYYHKIRSQAADDLHDLRKRNVGDVIASTLELVRKHPGPGVIVALACGWFAGRIFRR